MNNNILICLLFILIAYTIFKILSNICNGFSVGGDEDQCQEYINNIVSKCCDQGNINNCPQGFPNYCDTICSQNIDIFRDNCSNTGVDGDDITDKIYNNIIDKSCKKTCSNKEIYDYEKQSCVTPPLINLQPIDGNAQELFKGLKEAYNNPTSNGVFISMINNQSNNNVYLDGSGCIIQKDIYDDLYEWGECNIGFIWDTNWLEPNEGNPLVDCLFPIDSITTPICTVCGCDSNILNTCKLTNTSKPDRCTTGLQYYFRTYKNPKYPNPEYPADPTNCTENIRYVMDKKPHREPLNEDENCFKYIVDVYKNNNTTPVLYNEAVFLKDINEGGIEINEGLKELTRLNKPTPVALVFLLYNMKCPNRYTSQVKAFKLKFTPKTVVIRININHIPLPPGVTGPGGFEFLSQIEFVGYTTLDQIPGYNNL